MSLLNFLPDFLLALIINFILFVGVVGAVVSSLFKYIIKYFPWLVPHRTVLQIVSIVLLAIGVYLKGAYNTEMLWRERVREAEAKVKIAEEKAATATAQIEYKFIDKVRVVKDVQVVIQERIIEKEKIIDAECKVVPEALSILNQSAKKPGDKK